MNLKLTEQIPDDPDQLPPARRRRARRLLSPLNADEQVDFQNDLIRRAAPSFDFFLFSLLAGAVLSVGLLLDTPALLVLGAVLAPLMLPPVGIALGTSLGSGKVFGRSLAGLLLGGLIVLGIGALAGLVVPARAIGVYTQAHLHTQLSWPHFLVLAVAGVLTVLSIVHASHETNWLGTGLPSVALAYELYLPLAAAGLGLTSGEAHLWPDGLVVFSLHLSWMALLGALTLILLGFRPLTTFGYTLGGAVTLLGVILLIGISGAGAALSTQAGLPTHTPTLTATFTLTPTHTRTPVPPTATHTPTLTLTPTLTATASITPSPTPAYALVTGGGENGVVVRAEPGGLVVDYLRNGDQVEVVGGAVEQDGIVWVEVLTPRQIRGWMQQILLTALPATATP